MKIQYKKIVITYLLGLYASISIGCSQTGANMIAESNEKKGTTWSIIKSRFKKKTTLSCKKPSAENSVTETNRNVIVKYEIDKNDQLHLNCSFKPTSESGFDANIWAKERDNQSNHQKLFNLFAAIIPQEHRKGIQYFQIFDPKGILTVATMGNNFANSLKIFCLSMAYNLFENEDLYYDQILDYPFIISAMIHELGHYLTMNDKQQCIVNNILKAKDDSVLKQLTRTYYAYRESYGFLDSLRDQNDIPKECKKQYQQIEEYIAKRKKELVKLGIFTTEHAAKSYYEDAADTFVYFVFLDERPKPGNLLSDKVLLFYEYEKFVEIRQSIRANLKKLGIRPKMSREDLKKILDSLSPENYIAAKPKKIER